MKAEKLEGAIFEPGRNGYKPYVLSQYGDYFLDAFCPDLHARLRKDLDAIYEDFKNDPLLIDDGSVEFVRRQIYHCVGVALSNFREEVMKAGKEGLGSMHDTFTLEFFLQNYMYDWEHDDSITLINDYERYLNPGEREDFIECNPRYEDWMATDEDEIHGELDRLYAECIDEAWENFTEDKDW